MAVRKPAEEPKAEFLDAALRLADEIGPDRLSTESIGREVGLTQPGIWHFPTKQAIWEAVAGSIATRMAEGWKRRCNAGTIRSRDWRGSCCCN